MVCLLIQNEEVVNEVINHTKDLKLRLHETLKNGTRRSEVSEIVVSL